MNNKREIEGCMKEKLEHESVAEEVEGQSPEEDDDGQSPAPDEQASEEDEGLSPDIKPVRRKIGEGRDNLRRREEWFQRRTGTGK
jgi:hypothetical protein